MSYEKFIAKRYLFSKHKINFISIISFISITGITLGVAALIVVLSVFNGFGSLVTSFLMNFDPHIRVEFKVDSVTENYNETIKSISNISEIKDFAPFVSGKVLAFYKGNTEVISLKGIENKKSENIYGIKGSIIFGKGTFTSDEAAIPGIIIGLRLADRLQVLVNDTITIVSPAGIEKVVTQFGSPNTQQFIVQGIFSSQNNEYDAGLAFTTLQDAQFLLGFDDTYQGIDIKLDNFNNASGVRDLLLKKLDKNSYDVSTWYDFHKELYSMMQIERWVAYILLSLIIAVASFNILGSLSMSVIEKKRDIGIMRSMGSQEKSILKIFMYEGLMIGIIGTSLGVVIGYFICFLQLQYNIYPLDPTQYKISSMPLELRISDFFYITGISLLLSIIASYIPAKRAARVDALQAIKWE